MSFTAEIDSNAAAAAEESDGRQGGGDGWAPLPKGRYIARIVENKGIVPAANSGANATKKAINLRVDILDGSPTGAKRVQWVRVPLFSRWAPNEKNPQGASAWMFWNFFEKVMGVPRVEILSGKPLPSNVEGKLLTIILGEPRKPTEKSPLGSNEIVDVDAPDADFSRTPIRVPGVPVAPWLTANDELIPNHPSLGGAPAGLAAGGVAPGLPGLPGNVTPIGGGATPGLPGLPGAPAGTGLPQPSWGQPAVPAANYQAPSALQQAAARGTGF